MATQPRENFDFEQQRVRIRRAVEESEKFTAGQEELMAEEAKLRKDTALSPWSPLVQGPVAGAVLLGADAAPAKYLIG